MIICVYNIVHKMDVKEYICRLCFNNIDTCEILDDTITEIFDILLIELNMDLCRITVICGDCMKITLRCLRFKSMYVHKEQQKLSFTISTVETKFMLMSDVQNMEYSIGNVNTCTFCKKEVKSEAESKIPLPQTLLDMVPIFLPEKYFQSSEDHITCRFCKEELEVYFKFITNCIHIEDMINTYIQQNLGKMNLIDIQYWLRRNGLNSPASYTPSRQKSKPTESFSCEICPYVAKRKDSIKSHMLKHKDINEVDIHRCTICSYESRWKSSLRNHMKVHDDTVPVQTYKCPLCTYETKYRFDVKRHAVKHMELSEVNMYKCKHCTYETRYNSSFRSHQLIHKSASEVEMYKCLVCPYETKYKTSLKSHRLTHGAVVEMHKCSHEGCAFETKRKESLKVHVLTHKDASEVVIYKCTTCEYQTRRKNHLTAHLLVHKDVSEVVTHKCAECTYRTKYKSDLKKHMVTHMDVPQVEYKCETCAFVTKYKSNLKVHTKMHQRKTK